jgi:hypothetical protein
VTNSSAGGGRGWADNTCCGIEWPSDSHVGGGRAGGTCCGKGQPSGGHVGGGLVPEVRPHAGERAGWSRLLCSSMKRLTLSGGGQRLAPSDCPPLVCEQSPVTACRRECWPKLNVCGRVQHGCGKVGFTLSTRADLTLS